MSETSSENEEDKILNVISQQPKGVTDAGILKQYPAMDKVQLVKILNSLLQKEKIQPLMKGNQLIYKLKGPGPANVQQCSDVEEKLVYEAIAKAGNDGILSQSLNRSLKLNAAKTNQILKNLDNKKLIKCVTSTTKKKLYMLSELEPSQAITGGVFYSGQEFESEFVNAIGEQCVLFLQQARSASEKYGDPVAQKNACMKSSKEICDHISSLQISKVKLSVKDIECILEALIYDGKIEKSVSIVGYSSKSESRNLYRVSKPLLASAALMRMPCGVCTVYRDCHEGGEISPSTCVYMKEWLDF